MLTLVPGVVSTSNDVGGISTTSVSTFSIHGGRGGEGRLQLDGMGIGGTLGGGGTSMYNVDVGNAAEIVFTTSGGLGEMEVGGPVMSIVPRTGGNTMRGSVYANGSSGWLQGSNFTDELRAVGLQVPGELKKLWDLNGSFGGPIRRDRALVLRDHAVSGQPRYTTNMFYNRNAGDPTKWTYAADTRRAENDGTWKNTTLRLTLQATPQEHLQYLLGRADDPHRPPRRRQLHHVARGGGHERRGAAAGASGHVALPGHRARPARGRLFHQRQPLRRP